MKKADLREEYTRADLPGFERGKFYPEAVAGTTVVVLNPEIAKAFPTSDAVNKALAGLLAIAHEARKLTAAPKRAPKKRASA